MPLDRETPRKTVWNKWMYLYIITECCLFILIKTAEIREFPYAITGKLMYSAIVLNFIVVWSVFFVFRKQKEAGTKSLIPAALTCTLGADFFLVLTDRFWMAGVLLFCIVQTLYAIELARNAVRAAQGKRTVHVIVSAGLRLLLFLVFLSVLYRVSYLEPLSALGVLSMAMLTANVLFAWKGYAGRKTAGNLLFALGLLLFAGCDLCLGLRNYSLDIYGAGTFYRAMALGVWSFYVPSQAAIVMSYTYKVHSL